MTGFPIAHWFSLYRGPLATVNGGFSAVGAYFTMVVLMGGSPIGADLYGPEVHAIPALFWSLAQFSIAALAVLGVLLQGRRGAILSALMSVLLIALFSVFCTFASRNGQGTIVFAGTLFLCLPGAWFTLISAMGAIYANR